MFHMSTVGNTAHIKQIVQLLPNGFQHALSTVATVHPGLLKGEAHRPVLSQTPQKEIARCEIWRPARPGHENAMIFLRRSDPSVKQCCVQKLSNPETPVRWHPIMYENEDSSSLNLSINQFPACRGTCHH